MSEHREPAPVRRGDVYQALEVAGWLRNLPGATPDGDVGEAPSIVERGAEPHLDHPQRAEWDPTSWRYEIHAGCGEVCPVMAVVPYDGDWGRPIYPMAEAIAQAGEVILGLVAAVRERDACIAELEAQVDLLLACVGDWEEGAR